MPHWVLIERQAGTIRFDIPCILQSCVKTKTKARQGRQAGANCWQTIKRLSAISTKRAAAAAPPDCKLALWVDLPEARAGTEGDVRARVCLHSAVVVAVVLQEKKWPGLNHKCKTFNPLGKIYKLHYLLEREREREKILISSKLVFDKCNRKQWGRCWWKAELLH